MFSLGLGNHSTTRVDIKSARCTLEKHTNPLVNYSSKRFQKLFSESQIE